MDTSTQNFLQDLRAPNQLKLDGILRCSRYAFGPNRLHYCGPDANREILAYMEENESDFGLAALLKQFKTLFPYLTLIARANGLKDPFDERVIEAYWIGNSLLENVEKKMLYNNLTDDHGMRKRLKPRDFSALSHKVGLGALPHHSFHVLNIWKRTGSNEVAHTLESMNDCIVSCGTVRSVDGPSVTIETNPLIVNGGTLQFADPVIKKVTRSLTCLPDLDHIQIGDIVSVHWGVPCEVITPREAARLKHFTQKSIELANRDL